MVERVGMDWDMSCSKATMMKAATTAPILPLKFTTLTLPGGNRGCHPHQKEQAPSPIRRQPNPDTTRLTWQEEYCRHIR